MPKYLVLYRSATTAADQMARGHARSRPRPGMDAWMAWAQQAGDTVVDLGSPLEVVEAGGDTGDPIGGFSVLQAEDARRRLREGARRPPHAATGGTIEILQFLADAWHVTRARCAARRRGAARSRWTGVC